MNFSNFQPQGLPDKNVTEKTPIFLEGQRLSTLSKVFQICSTCSCGTTHYVDRDVVTCGSCGRNYKLVNKN